MEPVKSVVDFIGRIIDRPSSRRVVTYRGHGRADFRLEPSIFRKDSTRESEHLLLRELVAAHPEDFDGDTTALEMLVRMQHYSLPTRLLDVSLNPLVALYFACESIKKREPLKIPGRSKMVEQDGQVIILEVYRRRIKYFDSDAVCCLANLARLPYALKKAITPSGDIEAFNDTKPIKRLLHFIRQEKNGFLPEIDPIDLTSIFLVKPKQNNKRILAQAGAFFVFGKTEEIDEDNEDGIHIERIDIDAGSKGKILKQLDKLGINEKTLFPEIERAARYITGSLSTGETASKLLKRKPAG